MRTLRDLFPKIRVGLLPRIAIALAAVGVVPLAVTGWRLIDLNQNAMFDQVLSTHALAARTSAEGVGNYLAARISLGNGLASNPALQDSRSPAARLLLTQNLQAWAGLDIVAIVVVNPEGDEVIRAQIKDLALSDEVELLLAQPPSELSIGMNTRDGLLIRSEAELTGGIGRLWVFSNAGNLETILDPREMGQEAEILLASPPGSVLAGPVSSLEDIPQSLLDLAFAGTQGAGEFRNTLSAHAPVPHSDWAVISRQPSHVARQVALRMRSQAWWAIAGASLLVALISAVTYGSIIRPIRELAQAQRRLAGLGATTPAGDEISQLRESFEALERSLRARDDLDKVFLGRYQVVEMIGSGAMGAVFKGWDPKLERPVALKTVRLDRSGQGKKKQEAQKRLLREAVTVARFNHPNIVAVYDVEDQADGAFVAMEYVDGVSLDSHLWQEGKLAAGQTIPLGAAMAMGLAAAHQNEIVHRDIKPGNVLLGWDGGIKVTDFGISELISAIEQREDVVFGTPGFLPPEALQGRGYDERGDLFSLGVVLYLCLAGDRPFKGKSLREVVRSTLFGPVEALGKIQPDVPPDLDYLVMKLLERDPNSRPASAQAVAEMMQAMADRDDLRWLPPTAASAVTENTAQAGVEGQWVETRRLST